MVLLQHLLDDLEPDGVFGPRTEAAVEAFQGAHDFYADGVAGPATFDRLYQVAEEARRAAEIFDRQGWETIQVDGPRTTELVIQDASLPNLVLRSETAVRFRRLMAELVRAGGTMTTAGGRRALSADVSATRSSTSFHYAGAAFDLGLPSGAHRPETDPFIVTRDDGARRRWRVWARADGGEVRRLRAISVLAGGEVDVQARVIDFTALAQAHGFRPISARPAAWRDPARNGLGMEWWHWSDVTGLARGGSLFGEHLLRSYTWHELRGTSPWERRYAVFGVDWR